MEDKKDFFEKVYELVKQIPCGRVATYGDIAKQIGSPQSARVVGWAMNASHGLSEEIPAHRVVNRNGRLTGKAHFAHPDLMQKKLEAEGVQVKNDEIINFNEIRWDFKNINENK
ncbi:MGMT family protein [Ornithobacterium rhinotracheale]|uniref:MGMT family protein n=1 Tax=Ornithobacterium rhinotracheale TaxID=28251 RepID=UPI00403603CE